MDKLSAHESLSIVVELIPAGGKLKRFRRELRGGNGASQEIVYRAAKIVGNAGKIDALH